MSSGFSLFLQTPFNAKAHKAARQYLAMESLKVQNRLPHARAVLQTHFHSQTAVHSPGSETNQLAVVARPPHPNLAHAGQVRLPLRELLYKSCMERSSSCLHYNPRGRISQFNQSEIYSVIKSAWWDAALCALPAARSSLCTRGVGVC